MPTLDTTVGGADANSYCSLADANTFHDASLYSETWRDATDLNRVRALITATRLVDEQFDFVGVPTTAAQRLKWPRFGAYDTTQGAIAGVYGLAGYSVPSTEIPRQVRDAIAEYAKWLLAEDRTAEGSDEDGLKRVKAGSVEVEFVQGTRGKPLVPSVVGEMLRVFAVRAAGDMTVPLVRV